MYALIQSKQFQFDTMYCGLEKNIFIVGICCNTKYEIIPIVFKIKYGINNVFTFFLILSFHIILLRYINKEEKKKNKGTATVANIFDIEY